jgi:site-specific DNA-methyltransferase (adenine-specific)
MEGHPILKEQASIIKGDALTSLRSLPSACVDAVITDPPYGDTSLAWDVIVNGWTDEVLRVLKPSGSMWIFGSMRYLFKLAPTMGAWHFVQDIVWEKHNGSGSQADRFRRVHEHATQWIPRDRLWAEVYHEPQFTNDARKRQVRRKKRPPHWGEIGESSYTSEDGGPRLMRSVMQVRSCHHEAIHPTQKPEGILEPLVLYSTPIGGLVVDPFCGSASTGAAALRHHRRFIGIEIDSNYVEAGCSRLTEQLQQEAAMPLYPDLLPPPHVRVVEHHGRIILADQDDNVYFEVSPDGYDKDNNAIWSSPEAKTKAYRRALALKCVLDAAARPEVAAGPPLKAG